MNDTQILSPLTLLVGLDTASEADVAERSLDELADLVQDCGAEVVGRLLQKRAEPDRQTFVGSGKLQEIEVTAAELGADLIVFDGELTPAQLRNIRAQTERQVLDRTMVILDIFARRARTDEGKIQVELAQLRFNLSRLVGKGQMLSRLGGGIGTRGPGETKLESDRRHILRRIRNLNERLKQLESRRLHQRTRRRERDVTVIAVVGYTNAGKSTLVNRLCGSDIQVADQLFMTLDPTARRLTEEKTGTVLVDTVGFIRSLPRHLAEAFRATLEEVQAADAVAVVVDASDPAALIQLDTVWEQLRRLDVLHLPTLLIANKLDQTTEAVAAQLIAEGGHYADLSCAVSARTGLGLEELAETLETWPRTVHSFEVMLPYHETALVARLQAEGDVEEIQYETEGIRIRGRLTSHRMGLLTPYLDALDEAGRTSS